MDVIENIDEAAREIAKVFGVREAMVSLRVPNDIESIIEAALETTKEWSGTFAVRTNRAFKEYPLTSIQINSIVGEKILESNRNLRVDLANPENILEIEIREDYAYIYEKRYSGFGGLPYGVSGKGIALMSGGIDSTLAAWLMMKRGMKIVGLHLDLTPYYSEKAKNRFFDALEWLREWTPNGRMKAYIVPIGDIHAKVRLPALRYRCVFCKMLMLKIAEHIVIRERAHAIITGEVLSQVASQTPVNMMIIDSITDIPVIRPVIHMDKDEIDKLAQKIGLYNIVARDVGECALVPKRPAIETEPEIAEILKQLITRSTIQEALSKAEKIY